MEDRLIVRRNPHFSYSNYQLMIEKFYFTMRVIFILFKLTFHYESTFKYIFKIHDATPWGLKSKTVFDNRIYFYHPLMFIIEERILKNVHISHRITNDKAMRNYSCFPSFYMLNYF